MTTPRALPTDITAGVTTGHADAHAGAGGVNDVHNRAVTTDDAQSITAVKTFVANPVFNDAAIPEAKVSGLVADLAAAAHLAGVEAFTGVKTFTANPVFNDSAIPQAKVANLTSDLSGVAHLAGTEAFTGVKTFTANPVFNDSAIPQAKVANLVADLATATSGISAPSVYNGRSYGLAMDGVTNDSAAWEALITTVNAAGGGVILLDGPTIKLGTDLGTVDGFAHAMATYCSNVKIKSWIPGGTTFKVANGVVATAQTRIMVNRKCGASAGALAVTGDHDVVFENITFDGNAFHQTVNTHGFCARFAKNVQLINCVTKNTYGTDTSANETFGFDALQSADIEFLNCKAFSDDGGDMSSGFSANFSTNVRWIDCDSHDEPSGQAFTAAYCSNLQWIGCRCQGAGAQGFNIEHCENFVYSACISGGKSLTSSYNADNPYGSGGTALPNAFHGFNVQSCSYGTWIGCTSTFNTSRGLNVTWDGSILNFNLMFDDFLVRSNGSDGAYISHCYQVRWNGQSISNGNYGIYVDTPSTSGDTILEGLVTGNTSYGVNQTGSSNAPYVDISRLLINNNNGGSANNQCQMGIGGSATTFQPVGVQATRVPSVPVATTTPASNPYPFDCTVVLSSDGSTSGLTVQVADTLTGTFRTAATMGASQLLTIRVPRRGQVQFGAGTIGTVTWTWTRA